MHSPPPSYLSAIIPKLHLLKPVSERHDRPKTSVDLFFGSCESIHGICGVERQTTVVPRQNMPCGNADECEKLTSATNRLCLMQFNDGCDKGQFPDLAGWKMVLKKVEIQHIRQKKF